jgi:aminoglycoside phosphotransferase
MEPRSDPRLEAAIRAVGAWRGRDVGVTPVSIGDDERHYLIEAGDDLFMLRLASHTSARPRPDATGELELMRSAAIAGVAPEVVAALPQLGCLVTRFAPGRRLTSDDVERDDVLASVVGSLRALHACPTPASPRSVFQEARELHRAALSRGIAMPPTEAAASEAVARIEGDHVPDPHRLVSCHGDLTRASLLLAGDHVWIVDFRWAGAGDPFEDLGSLAAHLDLGEERADALLAMYFGSITDGSRERLRALRAAAQYLAAMRGLTRPSTDPQRARREAEGRLRDVVVAVDALPG